MARKEWRERRGSNQSQTPAFPKEKPRKPAPVNKILHLASMNVFTMMDLIETPFFVSFVSTLLRACARATCFQLMFKTCEACECSAWLARRSAFLPVLLVVPCAFTPAVAIAKSVIVTPSSLQAFSALVI